MAPFLCRRSRHVTTAPKSSTRSSLSIEPHAVFSYYNETMSNVNSPDAEIDFAARAENSLEPNANEPSAEVLESRTTGWVAQCRELHCAPPFGSFVRAPDASPEDARREVVYGVVAHIETLPFEANRRPLALWTSENDMDARHPQIGKLLRTTFEVRCIGWTRGTLANGAQIHQSLPPQPPRLHSFVNRCDAADVRAFTAKHDWIRLLFDGAGSNGGASADELLVAACHEAFSAYNGDIEYSIEVGKTLALLLRADYLRLRAILSRIGI